MSGKDFYEFGCAEEQARELLHVVMEYLGKIGVNKIKFKGNIYEEDIYEKTYP